MCVCGPHINDSGVPRPSESCLDVSPRETKPVGTGESSRLKDVGSFDGTSDDDGLCLIGISAARAKHQ